MRCEAVFVLSLLFNLIVPAKAADFRAKIQRLLDTSPAIRKGFIGLQVADLKSGRILFESNAGRLFVPASNTKLFTTALGLMRLGPDHRFLTTITADREPAAGGRIEGPLTLRGGGDPNLSGREIPYRVDSPPGNPLRAIEDLADQVVARGVRRIDGDIVGDDTVYSWDPYPDGWGIDDAVNSDGAPVSALTINDNTLAVTVQPGEPALIFVNPPLEYYSIDNRVGAAEPRKIRIDRDPGSRQVRIWGTLPLADPIQTYRLAIDDPALYAAMALKDALGRRGVEMRGGAVAKHAYPGEAPAETKPAGIELARITSDRLVEDLRVTDKVSQNLHAELVLRAVALARRGVGSNEAGLEELRAFMKEAGIARSEYELNDGSGLARKNLLTPAAIVKLLRFMYRSQQRENWLSLLPIGAEDGSLRLRFQKTAAAGRIRAKTGTLSHVTALSGYAERRDGSLLAFSILSNNQQASSSEVHSVIDKIGVWITE